MKSVPSQYQAHLLSWAEIVAAINRHLVREGCLLSIYANTSTHTLSLIPLPASRESLEALGGLLFVLDTDEKVCYGVNLIGRPIIEPKEGVLMSAQESLRVVQAHFQSHDPESFFAEHAEFQDMSMPERLRGREALGAMMHMLHQEAFSEAPPEVRSMVAQENSVVVEWVFHSKNTGSFMGAPSTGKTVALPSVTLTFN